MKANRSDVESVSDVMKRVSHADLLFYYFGINSLPVLINSPLRTGDEHPSFFIYSPDGTKVLYRDYATGDKGDIYTLLAKRDNLSFSELIRKIASEKALLKKDGTLKTSAPGVKPFTKTPIDIKVKTRDWKDYDLQYWESFGISLQWLKYAEVYPISHKIIYKGDKRYVFHAAKYAYVFVERKEDNVSLKIYQPFSVDNKWMTSTDGSVVGLWTKVPQRGDRLVICSSLKDALCLWSNTGIPAIYVQSETTGLSQTAQEVLKNRFKKIFICFDTDDAGKEDAIKLSSETGFTNIVPDLGDEKDLSDAFRHYGREWFIANIKPLFRG